MSAANIQFDPDYSNALAKSLGILKEQPTQELQRSKQPSYLTAPKRKSNRGKSHKRLINKACLEVLESERSTLREKMKAAAILERMCRERDLASRRRKRERAQITSQTQKTNKLGDILSAVSSNSTNAQDLRQASTRAEDKANVSTGIAGDCGTNDR